jgi:hypothetical protein
MTPPTILCRGNVIIELLPSNGRGIETQRAHQFLYCYVYSLSRERVYRDVA